MRGRLWGLKRYAMSFEDGRRFRCFRILSFGRDIFATCTFVRFMCMCVSLAKRVLRSKNYSYNAQQMERRSKVVAMLYSNSVHSPYFA